MAHDHFTHGTVVGCLGSNSGYIAYVFVWLAQRGTCRLDRSQTLFFVYSNMGLRRRDVVECLHLFGRDESKLAAGFDVCQRLGLGNAVAFVFSHRSRVGSSRTAFRSARTE